MTQSRAFEFDVYISYSHNDRAWVHDQLLPQLKAARMGRRKMRVCIDTESFEPGAPSLDEMERAVISSRKTVVVLSPRCLASDAATLEHGMAQTLDLAGKHRRLIPLLLEKCELPVRISRLTYVDFTHPASFDASLQELLRALRARRGAQPQEGVEQAQPPEASRPRLSAALQLIVGLMILVLGVAAIVQRVTVERAWAVLPPTVRWILLGLSLLAGVCMLAGLIAQGREVWARRQAHPPAPLLARSVLHALALLVALAFVYASLRMLPANRQVLQDPGFELGLPAWRKQSTTKPVLVSSTGNGRKGHNDSQTFAWFGGWPGDYEKLSQEFWVSPRLAGGQVVFYYQIDAGGQDCASCRFDVWLDDRTDSPANRIAVAQFSSLDDTGGQYVRWIHRLEDFELKRVAAANGELRVVFELSNSAGGFLAALVDDVTFETRW